MVVTCALLPVLVLAFRAFFQDWLPVGDVAAIGARVGEVGTGHSPLVGPYSHFGWSHPGPLLFEALAVPYRLSGSGGTGLLLGALLVNGTCLAVIVSRLHRFGGLALAALGIVCFGLVSWSLGTAWLWYPWNPNLCVLPFAALLVVTWTTAANLELDLPLLALLASFIAQSHVAYVPFVVVLVPIALVGRARRVAPGGGAPGTGSWMRRHRAGVLTGVVLVVAWTPPVVDAIAHSGGNFRRLADFWLTGHPGMGLGRAFRIVCLELSPRAPWLGFHEPTFIGAVAPRGFPVPIALFALVAAVIVAWRTHDRLALRAGLVVLAAIAVATLSISRIVGLAYPYLVFQTRVLGAATWLVVGWTALRLVERGDAWKVRRGLSVAAVIGASVVTVMVTISALSAGIGPHGEQEASPRLARVVDRVRAAIGDDPGTVRVTSAPSFSGGTFKAGLVLALLQDGYDARTDGSDRIRFGNHLASDERGDVELLVTSGSREFEGVPPSYRLVAESSRPVDFPSGAPRPHRGEDPHAYLSRVKGRVDPRTYRQLVANLTGTYPIAVFAAR